MLKNIDKCGFYKKFDGKIQFSPKVSNPKSTVKSSVGTVITATKIEENKANETVSKSSSSVKSNKKRYKTESAFAGSVNTGLGGGISAFSFGSSWRRYFL